MLHADADFSVAVERSVEAHYVGGVTFMEHLQLPNDLVPDGWFDLQVDQLQHRRQFYLCSQIMHRMNGGRSTPVLCTYTHTSKSISYCTGLG